MSNMNELRLHLDAVKQTRQITNAMYLLSTSRMKKAMQNMDFNVSYLKRLRATAKDVLSKTESSEYHNDFIEKQSEGTTFFIVVTADKGLCGGYNSDIVKLAVSKMNECEKPILASIGTVGSDMLSRMGITPDYTWYDVLQHPSLYISEIVSKLVISLYVKHKVKEAFVVYTEYKSPSLQIPVCKRILPLLSSDFSDVEYEFNYTAEPIYEPSVNGLFEKIVPQYVAAFMYNVLIQSAVCENSARMNAMQSATDNADKMTDELMAQINAQRQLAITNEIIEIASASDITGAV